MEVSNQGSPNLVKPPAPHTKSIGRSGSFWLPPRSTDTFSIDQGKPARGKAIHSQKLLESSKFQGEIKSSKQNAHPVGSHKRSPTPSPDLNQTKIKPDSFQKNRSLPQIIKQIRLTLGDKNNYVKTLKTNVITHKTSYYTKDLKTEKINSNFQQHRDTIDEDGGRKDGRSNKQFRGMKHAPAHTKMNQVNIDDGVVYSGQGERNNKLSLSNESKSFAKHAAKTMVPKIAYLSKHDKKVVRFAFDLPSGVKLGVRLEKSGGDISICFISPNESTIPMLSLSKDSILKALHKETTGHLEINVFHSYKEMDIHHAKAA